MVDYTKRPNSQPSQPSSGSGTGGVNLSKVTLTKSAPSISLTKGGGASGQMRVNLNWTQQASKPSGGFLKKALGGGGGTVDLDLGCLWETRDGGKGVVQALGNQFGNLHRPPYVELDGDDRSGSNTGGENLTVNLDHLDEIKRILIFAYIYEGVPNWAAADGVVTLYPQGAQPIEVRLDEGSNRNFCAIAMLTNEGGSLKVNREVNYISGSQSDLDRAYGWGMNWTAGRK